MTSSNVQRRCTRTGWRSSTSPARRARSAGSPTGRWRARARGMALRAGPDGRSAGRAGGDRVAELGPVHDLLLRGQRLRPGPRPDQLPAQRRRGRLHRRALRRDGAAGRPRARRGAGRGDRQGAHRARRRGRRRAVRRGPGRGRRPGAVGAGRGRHLHHQLHLGHDRAAQGRAADAPQLLAQRTSFGWHTSVTDRDVLLHTLPMFHANGWGMPYAVTAMGGAHVVCARSTARRSCAGSRPKG